MIRPLLGIESNKHQPIVKANKGMNISITPHEASPIVYMKHYYDAHRQILSKFAKIDPIAARPLSSKGTQTIYNPPNDHIPSSASGTQSKYFSLK